MIHMMATDTQLFAERNQDDDVVPRHWALVDWQSVSGGGAGGGVRGRW